MIFARQCEPPETKCEVTISLFESGCVIGLNKWIRVIISILRCRKLGYQQVCEEKK